MKTKEDIVGNWLPRYTDTPLDGFGNYVLLTNFISYTEEFARIENAEIRGRLKPMQTATSSDGITIINFGMGSPTDFDIGNYLLTVASVYHNAGSDGKDLGPDWDELDYATRNTISGESYP
jgi:AMP nucleosidase